MRWEEPGSQKRSGGRKEPQRFVAEAVDLRNNPQRWADLEVKERGRELWDLAYNLRRGRFSALPAEEFEVRVSGGKLYCRYRGRFDWVHPEWMFWCERVAQLDGRMLAGSVSNVLARAVQLGFVLVPPQDLESESESSGS